MKRNEQTRTIGFVLFGILMCAAAGATHYMTQPKNSKDFELVGQPFYESFDSATKATSLEVAAMDPDSARLKKFSVADVDGLWRIPSHYNYPAEAAQRLAATATSVLGINRDSLVGRLESEHERFGVLDPLGEDARDPESTGQRITLKDDSDEILADYIVGKEAGEVERSVDDPEVEGGLAEKYYYIRRPDEMQTYKVKLNIDLSTKFSDWIEPDLLQLEVADLRRINIDNYELKEQGGLAQRQVFKMQGDQLTLSRKDGFGKWDLDGLKEETEEVETTMIDKIVGVLDSMKIVGVRPKFKYNGQQLVTADLQLNEIPELAQDPRQFNQAMNQLLTELSRNGFTIYENPDPTLISTFGALEAGTGEGIVYTLNFGKSVEGDDDSIEIGGASEDAEPAESEDSKPADSNEAEESAVDPAEKDPKEAGNEAEGKNRFLMIRVGFDETLLGDRPVKPTEPVKPEAPEGYTPAADDAAEEGESTEDAAPKQESENSDEAPAPSSDQPTDEAEDKEERDPAFIAYEANLKAFEEATTKYTLDLTRFEDELKDFEAKVKDGEKRVAALNERFGEWYYVISAENLASLQSKRADVVKAKEVPADAAGAGQPERPDISFDVPEGIDLTAPPEKMPAEGTEENGDDDKGNGPEGDGAAETPKDENDNSESQEESGAESNPEPMADDDSENATEPSKELPDGAEDEKELPGESEVPDESGGGNEEESSGGNLR